MTLRSSRTSLIPNTKIEEKKTSKRVSYLKYSVFETTWPKHSIVVIHVLGFIHNIVSEVSKITCLKLLPLQID